VRFTRTLGLFAALALAAQAQTLLTGPNRLTFTATAGGANPPTQTVGIRQTGATPVGFTVQVSTASGGNWLSASLSSGTTPARLTVNASPAGLPAGNYIGSININAAGAGIAPGRIDVVLTVVPTSQLQASPTSLSFFRHTTTDVTSGEQLIFVNTTGSPAGISVTPSTTDGGSWLLASVTASTTPGVVSVRVNPSGLAAGTYNGSLAIASQGLTTVNVPVTLTVSTSPFLTATPAVLNLAAVRNGSAVTQSISLQPSGGVVPFTVSTSTNTGGNWLIVNPANGAAPGNLDVSATPGGLPAGVYTGNIQLLASSASNSTTTIPITFTVTDSPVINSSQRSLSITVPSDPTQSDVTRDLPAIQITASAANVNYTVSTTTSNGGPWLLAGPSSGTAPGTINSIVDATGLPSGTYSGAITVTSGGNAITIPVTLTVTSSAQLTVDPSTVTFNLQKGQTAPSNQVVNVNSTGASFAWQSTITSITPAGATWLGAGASSGTTPSPLVVGVNSSAATLPNGQYNATVTFSGQAGINPAPPNSPTLNVVLNVSDTALFNVSPATIDFVVSANTSLPPARPVAVTATDNSSQAFTATATTQSGGNWLLVGPTAGNTPTNLNVQVLPLGLGVGVYEGTVAVTVPSISATPQNVRVRLIVQPTTSIAVAPTTLSFTQAGGGAPPASQNLNVSANGPANFQVTTSTNSGGEWLSVSPSGGAAPGVLSVSVNAGSLAPGNYTGSIGIASAGANNSPLVVPVALTVTAPSLTITPSAVSLLAAPGSTQAVTQQLAVSGASGGFTAGVNTSSGGNWLSVTPVSGTSPANVTVSANPTGLAAGTYTGTITFTAPGVTNSPQTVTVTFNVATAPPPGRQLLSQIADGAGWKTSVILVNLDTQPAPFTLRFFRGDGTVLPLAVEGSPGRLEVVEGIIPVGGSRTIQTAGTDTALSQGWAELSSAQRISGLGVFRQRTEGRPDQEAGVSATTPALRFVLPFDNTQGFVSSMALVNTNNTQARAVTGAPRQEDGSALPGDSVNLPLRGHTAFEMAQRFQSVAQRRGSIEFSSPSADFSALGLRFNPGGSFTSLPALTVPLSTDPRPTTQVISQVADGDGWKTTITLVNLDTVPAPFTLRFWAQNGTALSIPQLAGGSSDVIEGTIPVGGTRVIETLGGTSALVQGWAELSGTRAIGGLAVFRQRVTGRADQEAAVTLTATGNRFVLPFDNTENYVTSMALVNSSATVGSAITVVIRNEAGQQIGAETVSLSGRGHTAFSLSERFASTRNLRGTVEFTSTGSQITGLGLRFNPGGAFTSFPVLPRQ
jgi:hypothetical protein